MEKEQLEAQYKKLLVELAHCAQNGKCPNHAMKLEILHKRLNALARVINELFPGASAVKPQQA